MQGGLKMSRTVSVAWAIWGLLVGASGCSTASLLYQPPSPPEMLGSKVDQLTRTLHG